MKDVSSLKEFTESGTITDTIQGNTDTTKDHDQSTQTESNIISKSEGMKSKNSKLVKTKDQTTQTEEILNKTKLEVVKDLDKPEDSGWNINDNNKETKSIAEQVAEAAQDAMKESGMVYVESAGMYYDYKTGYYYNSVLNC